MQDFARNVQIKRVLSPVSVADNTAQVGQIIDRAGYDSLTYIIAIGSVASGTATFAVTLQEGDQANLSDAATVANTDMITQTPGTAPLTAAGFQFDSDDQVRKVGYIGNKRYTRLTITPTNNAAAALMVAVAVLNDANVRPVTQATA